MVELALSSDFLPAYAKLPRPVQRSVEAALSKFAAHTHAGMHLEKLTGACDSRVRTIRINQSYRGVVLALGHGNYLLHTVLPHDDAITFAMNRVISVNQVLGVLEVRDQGRLDFEGVASPAPAAGLFDGIPDAELTGLGVDEKLIPFVRRLVSDDELESFRNVLPSAQFDVLTGLASGMPVEEIREELADRIVASVDTGDLVAAARRTPERVRFISGPVELEGILAHPFDAWRIFLHPTQRDIAYRDSYSGSAQVTGGAGTGKTVTGLHRAVFLAKRLPDDGSRVLITTFTRALAESLKRQLRLLTDDRAVRDRIDVIGVDQLANQIVSAARGGRKIVIADEPLLRRLWDKAAKGAPTYFSGTGQVVSFSGAFLQREWEQVILAQRLTTLESYCDAPRRGRGGGLRTDQRERVWAAVSDVVAELAKQRKHTHVQVADEAARICERDRTRGYRHVVVDEGQDLHPAQWRLLRALVPSGPDDMFLLADPHQRIYDNQVSLARLGIDVRGRSRRLTVNYRTTHEILDWSLTVLTGTTPIGLDDAEDSLDGYRSITRGEKPTLIAHASRADEFDSLVERVGTWIEQGVEPDAIGVATRTNQLATQIGLVLREAHIPVSDETTGEVGVHVATMHRMKGLEFQCLAVAGLDRAILPQANAVTDAAEDPLSHKQDLMRERCLLFVAVTRARDAVHLSHTGAPSSLLPS